MSRNLHVASCYKIQYESVNIYSNQEEEFCRMLCQETETVWWENYGEGDRLEIEKCDLENFIQKIKDEPEILNKYDLGLAPDDLIQQLEYILAKSEPEDSVIHLEWF